MPAVLVWERSSPWLYTEIVYFLAPGGSNEEASRTQPSGLRQAFVLHKLAHIILFWFPGPKDAVSARGSVTTGVPCPVSPPTPRRARTRITFLVSVDKSRLIFKL